MPSPHFWVWTWLTPSWEKGSVCGSDTFIGFLLGFSLPEPGLMFTLISQTDHPRNILMSLPVLWRKICEGGCGKTHWDGENCREKLSLLQDWVSIDVVIEFQTEGLGLDNLKSILRTIVTVKWKRLGNQRTVLTNRIWCTVDCWPRKWRAAAYTRPELITPAH